MSGLNHLSHEEFFTQLTGLLKACHAKGHGTVLLSQKRLAYGNVTSKTSREGQRTTDNPLWDLDLLDPLPVIVRASNAASPEKRRAGDKKKISTVVKPDELEVFYTRYSDVCKKGMESLRKRDRSKKKKERKKTKKDGDAV